MTDDRFQNDLINPSERLTLTEASERGGVSTKTLRRWIQADKLIAQKVAGKWMTTRNELKRAIFASEKRATRRAQIIRAEESTPFASEVHARGVDPVQHEPRNWVDGSLPATHRRLSRPAGK
tara:strand:- start:164 stop:529 length:366 start_codon:yes stop_codon:yes gene_type:complete